MGKEKKHSVNQVQSLLESLKIRPSNSDNKSQKRQSSSKEPRKEDLLQLADKLRSLLTLEEDELDKGTTPEEKTDSQSWLDWGLSLLKQWGPKALEMAPELLALL